MERIPARRASPASGVKCVSNTRTERSRTITPELTTALLSGLAILAKTPSASLVSSAFSFAGGAAKDRHHPPVSRQTDMMSLFAKGEIVKPLGCLETQSTLAWRFHQSNGL